MKENGWFKMIHNLLKDNDSTSIRQSACDDMLWASMMFKQVTTSKKDRGRIFTQ